MPRLPEEDPLVRRSEPLVTPHTSAEEDERAGHAPRIIYLGELASDPAAEDLPDDAVARLFTTGGKLKVALAGTVYELAPVGPSNDGDAIHDNIAAEISAIAEKASPVNADLVIIEDSEDANAKKRVQVGNLPGGGAGDVATDAIWDALGDLLYGTGANTGARLAGQITATKKFLAQTGNGAGSAAPGWETIVDGDLPSSIARDSELHDESHAHARIDDHMDAYNGSFIEPFTFAVTSNGTTITGSLDADPTGDLTERFNDGYSTISTPITVTLTPGTDTAPVKNFVYILQSAKGTLVVSTSDWPTTEHIKVAEVILQSAATTQTEEPLANRFWNDHAAATNGQGHHLHAWERLRFEHSLWRSGVAISWTIDSGPSPDTIDLALTAGKVYQLHLQSVEAKNTATGDNVHVVNDSTTPYTEISDFADLLTDSAGGSMSGKYFNLVVWSSVSSGSEKEHLFVNLPSGSYNKLSDALADVLGYTDFNIPEAFRGYAFLVTRITLRHQAAGGGTWTSERETDLRGQVPNIIAGGGTVAITVEFADSLFRLFDDGDPTKKMSFQVSGVTAGQTRVMTVPDSDITLHGGTHHEKAESHIPMVALTVEQSF